MPIDFGKDTSCGTSLDPTMRMVSGFRLLAEALVRRVTTAHGSLLNFPNYGDDITALVDTPMTPQQVARLASRIDRQFLQDQRVRSSTTIATFDAPSGTVTARSTLMTANGPFLLVLGISSVTVSILHPTGTNTQ